MDVRCIDLDRVSDGNIHHRVHAEAAGGLLSSRHDQLRSLFVQWQRDAPDPVDIQTWVWASRDDHRKGECAAELDFILEYVIDISLRTVKSDRGWRGELWLSIVPRVGLLVGSSY